MHPRQAPAALLTALALAVACCGGSDPASPATPTTAAEDSSAPASTRAPDPITTSTAAATTMPVAEPKIEEVRFASGAIELAGDLVLPGGAGPHPAVILVHGDGPQTRRSTPGYTTVMQKFRNAGFAVFSWDKPGSGASPGAVDEEHELTHRAAILLDGIEFLAGHPAIDPARIGLWGLSQAGWVMPLAIDQTDAVAFMIVVSGGGEDSIEQLSYQIGQRLVCQGSPPEVAALVERYGPQAAKGTTYEEYVEAMEILIAIPGLEQFVGSEMASERDWNPWPPDGDPYLDPIDVIARTTIPVLAVFGELDKNIDPVQGATAYEDALQAAGNGNYHVELIPGVGHTMQAQATGCIGEAGGATSDRYLQLLGEWATMLATSL